MATLDEIFAAMPDTPAGGTHELLIIDPDTRQIEVPEIESIFGVITDGNAEKKYFQCPRYVGKGIDLAACKLRIAYQNASGTEEGRDGYLVQDLTESGGYVYFSWELSEKVCLFQGPVQFAVCATQGSAVVWNTDAATGTVLGGLPFNGEIVQTEMSDIIAQLIALVEAQSAAVEAAGAAQVQTVEAAAKAAQEAALAEIEAKKQNALAEIPADYTAVAGQVDKLTRSTAGAIVCQAEGETIQVHDASDNFLPGLRIFGRSTQDGTPTPDNPVEIVSTPAPVVTVCGKNLAKFKDGQCAVNGIEWECKDGVFTVKGTSSGTSASSAHGIIARLTGLRGTFCVSGNGDGVGVHAQVQKDGKSTWYSNNSFSLDGTEDAVSIYCQVFGADKSVDTKIYPMFNIGETPMAWEPYKGENIATVTPDSLPGIPVASGGNYTDANGQQWFCDEVDLARGVYVQRCFTETVKFELQADLNRYSAILSHKANANHAIEQGIPVLCDKYAFNVNAGSGTPTENGIRVALVSPTYAIAYYNGEEISEAAVMYPLAEPIETHLSEAELAAFAALHSVKPTTTILNDSGAYMAVEYVADTKLYIDGKLAELVAAMNA